jgi:GNAT superfamily N-acetyltransferase
MTKPAETRSTSLDRIRHYEELTLNAWPALHTLHMDGWIVRFANGYTRRANSINPLYPSAVNLDQKIRDCEAFYTQRGLPTIFKMMDACDPANLDAELEVAGYQLDAVTQVQELALAPIEPPHPQGLVISEVLTYDWLEVYLRLGGTDRRHVQTMNTMLNSIQPRHAFAALEVEGKAVAVGLVVQERQYVSFYDIVVDEGYRRHGLGTQLMQGLIAWGKAHGATTAFLQVMNNNSAALRLYGKLGFREIYKYWYRVKSL